MTTNTPSSSASPTAASDRSDTSDTSDTAVDLHTILSSARQDVVPAGWYVWPLRRGAVLIAALKWGLLAIIGLALFIPAMFAMVPADFDGNVIKGAISSVILVILGAVAFGGLGLALYELWRAIRAADYLLVMTPDDYVKFTPGKATHVPMSAIAYVTMRGVRLPEPAAGASKSGGLSGAGMDNGLLYQGGGMFSGLLYRGGESIDYLMRRNYRRAPASLAFLDLRNRHEVIVATDDAFDALPILEQVLQDYAHGIDYKLLK